MSGYGLEEIRAALEGGGCWLPRGGGTKPPLSTPPSRVKSLDVSGLTGVVEYVPSEYTVTALAGTPVTEIRSLLAAEGQHLPFDPLLGEAGATLGGTVAAGANGPGRLRFGGVRDFFVGVQFLDGTGRLIRGGGKVVKNAAGFDFPKLLVGSLGRLGVLVELTFKVFPAPASWASVRVDCGRLSAALDLLRTLTTAPVDLEALDLAPPDRLWVRIGGSPEALPARLEALEERILSSGPEALSVRVLMGEDEVAHWRRTRELDWVPQGFRLVKVPVTPRRIESLEQRLPAKDLPRIYSVGGQQLWLSWPDDEAETLELVATLEIEGLRAQSLLGSDGPALWGGIAGRTLARRVKQALDPAGRFPELA